MLHPELKTYAAWLPVLPGRAHESAARREAGRVADPRATHFWDADSSLGHAYQDVLRLPRGMPAWGVYFVFSAQARWADKPPTPACWMHQLSSAPSELELDGAKLARIIEGLLAGAASRARQ